MVMGDLFHCYYLMGRNERPLPPELTLRVLTAESFFESSEASPPISIRVSTVARCIVARRGLAYEISVRGEVKEWFGSPVAIFALGYV